MPLGSIVDENFPRNPRLSASTSRENLPIDDPSTATPLLTDLSLDVVPFSDEPKLTRRSLEAQATLGDSTSASPAIELRPVSASAVHAQVSPPPPVNGNSAKTMAAKAHTQGWVFYLVTVVVLLLAYIRYGITGRCIHRVLLQITGSSDVAQIMGILTNAMPRSPRVRGSTHPAQDAPRLLSRNGSQKAA